MNRIPPTNNLAFKKLMATEENKDILQGVISDMYHVVPDKITLTNPYDIRIYKELLKNGQEINKFRETIRDVTAILDFADFIMEMQVRSVPFFEERLLYYGFSRYCANYNKAEELIKSNAGKVNRYASIKPVYSLNILRYGHFADDDDALRVMELYDPIRGKGLNKNLLKIAFFELDKKTVETENQRHWQYFFNTGRAKENAPAYIKKAADIMDFANWSEEERNVALNYEIALADQEAREYHAWQEGLEEGLQKGKLLGLQKGELLGLQKGELLGLQKRTLEIAREAFKQGLSVPVIASLTGLDAKTIENLKEELL